MVKVITVSTDKKFYFPYLEDTCKANSGEFIALGLGEKWGGYVWKMQKMIEYLKSIDKNEFIVFVDGYDVICVKNLSTIVDQYREVQNKTDCKMIVATETNFLPKFISALHFGSKNGVLINTGTYLGFSGDILEVLSSAIKKFPNEIDDQVLLTNYAKLSGKDIYIDVDEVFFYVVGTPLCELVFPKKSPYFIHAPGCGFLTNILTNMKYVVDENIKEELKIFLLKKISYHTQEFVKRKIVFILIIVILFALICKYKKSINL